MSVKVYPVMKTAESIEEYEVFINGQKVELNTARVSAYQFNRRWPGHQRQIEQTELEQKRFDVDRKCVPDS